MDSALRHENSMVPEVWEVAGVMAETPGIVTLELSHGGGQRTPCHPGQFNMIGLPGIGEVPISISGVAEPDSNLLHTVRSVGNITSALCQLSTGDQVLVRGPFGRGWPVNEVRGRDVIIVAGGLGLAPVRPALRWILADRGNYGNIDVIYGARTPSDLLYSSELLGWGTSGNVGLHITVDTADRAWIGNVGVVTTVISHLTPTVDNVVVLVCGPDVMMRFAAPAMVHTGISEDDIYVSLERNMKCGVGLCGHCQLGPKMICKDGPVMSWRVARHLMLTREL